MDVFPRLQREGHEQVIFCHDRASGLKAIIAVHDTTLGPALGGCRMYPYPSEEAALQDALRLSRSMTYKSAAAGVDHGGGKAVIWGDPRQDKGEAGFRALGRFIEGLKGRFTTGPDLGTASADFVWTRAETRHVAALPEEYGGSGDSGPITAFGVYRGIKAALAEVYGSDSLRGRRVAVQGLGKVGLSLVQQLLEEGAQVTVADPLPEAVDRALTRHSALRAVDPDRIYAVACDVFSPCAVGGVVNDDTLPQLDCRVVAGAANNQLAEPRHGVELQRRGILYCPDFVINAGGLIQVADELHGFNRERAFARAGAIYDQLRRIFALSRQEGIPTHQAAELLAERRIAAMAGLGRIHVPE